MERPQVRDGVAALVCWAVGGVGGAWQAVLVGQGSVGLQGMAREGISHVHGSGGFRGGLKRGFRGGSKNPLLFIEQ